MTSWDSSVSFHINYSRLDSQISHSPSTQEHTRTHTHLCVDPQETHTLAHAFRAISGAAATGRCPCLKFTTLRDLYPFSIPQPEFITVTHSHTPIIIFIILAAPATTLLHYLNLFSRGAPIWLLMTFISRPLSSSSTFYRLYLFFLSLTVCVRGHAHLFVPCLLFSFVKLFASFLLFFFLTYSFLHCFSCPPPFLICPPFYLSLFSHYSLSLCH